MRRVREEYIEEPEPELRCYFCYCNMKNEIIYNLEDISYYHYECIIEKFRANEVEEFKLKRKDGTIETVKVPPEVKKNY